MERTHAWDDNGVKLEIHAGLDGQIGLHFDAARHAHDVLRLVAHARERHLTSDGQQP